MSVEPTSHRRSEPPAPHDPDAALDAIEHHLRELGVESATERTVRRTVPWVASLAIHLGVVLLAVLVAGTVRLISLEQDRPVIVADFDAMAYQPVTTVDPVPDAPDAVETPQIVDAAELDEQLQRQLELLDLDPSSLLAELDAPGASVSMNPDPAEGRVEFAGLSASNARRIVYVIDASGSLISSLQIVVEEMSRSLETLEPPQEFGVIFFQQDQALVAPPGNRLLPASPEQKLRTMQWIERTIVPSGNSNPLPAIEAAVRLEPDVIFLLSDNITGAGQYEIDQRRLLARLDAINPRHPRTGRRPVQINCIQFLDPDPLDTLELIAREHGGSDGYKFLDRGELGLR